MAHTTSCSTLYVHVRFLSPCLGLGESKGIGQSGGEPQLGQQCATQRRPIMTPNRLTARRAHSLRKVHSLGRGSSSCPLTIGRMSVDTQVPSSVYLRHEREDAAID